jgi:hypothetical protein
MALLVEDKATRRFESHRYGSINGRVCVYVQRVTVYKPAEIKSLKVNVQ